MSDIDIITGQPKSKVAPTSPKNSGNVDLISNQPKDSAQRNFRVGSHKELTGEVGDASIDPVTGQKKPDYAVPKQKDQFRRKHIPFTDDSKVDDRPNSESERVTTKGKFKELTIEQYDPSLDPITGQKKPEYATSPPKESHGRKHVLKGHSQTTPEATEHTETVSRKSSSGHIRAEIHEHGTHVDPITGKKKELNQKESHGRKQIPYTQGSAIKEAYNIVSNTNNDDHTKLEFSKKDKPSSPIQTVDPNTSAGVSTGVKSQVTTGRMRRESVEAHKDINPVTGEKIVRSAIPKSTSGSMRNEAMEQGSNVNPVTGEKVPPTEPRPPSSRGKMRAATLEQGKNINPVTGEPVQPK